MTKLKLFQSTIYFNLKHPIENYIDIRNWKLTLDRSRTSAQSELRAVVYRNVANSLRMNKVWPRVAVSFKLGGSCLKPWVR